MKTTLGSQSEWFLDSGCSRTKSTMVYFNLVGISEDLVVFFVAAASTMVARDDGLRSENPGRSTQPSRGPRCRL